jgi:hypothetical protein
MNTFLRPDDALLNNESAETLHETTYSYFCLLPSQFSTSSVLLLFLFLLAVHVVAETSTENNSYFRQGHISWIQMLECYHCKYVVH